jgi:hypothetical protein
MLISDLQGEYPQYFVYGPLVFSIATSQFLGSHLFGVLGSSLATRRNDSPAFPGEELVVVASPFSRTSWRRATPARSRRW